jgi:hypothetical protein
MHFLLTLGELNDEDHAIAVAGMMRKYDIPEHKIDRAVVGKLRLMGKIDNYMRCII